MKNFLSSTFSVAMLDTTKPTRIDAYPITSTRAKELVESFEASSLEFTNCVNPRHESTATLVGHLTQVACEGGFAAVKHGDVMVAILPPREFMNRDGDEIEGTDLESCQFFHLRFKAI